MTPEQVRSAAAEIVRGRIYKERYREWPQIGSGNCSNESHVVRHCDALADLIEAIPIAPDPLHALAEDMAKALECMIAEWEKMTRYGSPLAKAANENLGFCRAILARYRAAHPESSADYYYYNIGDWELTWDDLSDLPIELGEIIHVGRLKSLPSKYAVLINGDTKLFDTREEAQAALDAADGE